MSIVKRALLSVSDKSRLPDFARALSARNIELLSTGGTAKLLRELGLTVTEVSEYTGFPEIMDGRVKTLHPRVHGALLGRRGQDNEVMGEHGIEPIDLLIVNLYPFAATVAKPGCRFEDAIENIDIGGPAMLRAAAKNHEHVAVVVDPGDYDRVLAEIDELDGAASSALRRELAAKAFAHTAAYDSTIADYLEQLESSATLPSTFRMSLEKRADLRYGENPHQAAAFYVEHEPPPASLAGAVLHQGKPLSFNNIADADAALDCVKQFFEPACVIVKHANPCGAALDMSIGEAYERAFATDPTSAFGGIIAFNRPLDAATAAAILDKQFVEVLIAPDIDDDARAVTQQKTNVRVLTTGEWSMNPVPTLDYKQVSGGLLVQENDAGLLEARDLRVVTARAPSEQETRDMQFAWKVAKYVKSNAIVLCSAQATVGIGAGQMSRVYSTRLAAMKAADEGLQAENTVMASDAFFPFRDGIDGAVEAGVTAVIQPGGSKRDEEVIRAADEHGLAMLFTGMRHFRH